MASSKTNKAAIAARVAQILPLVTDGASEREILRFVTEKTNWGQVSKRTVENYIARAREEIIASSASEAPWHLAKALARYERLYWRASAKGDLGQCRQVEEAIVRLLGVAAPERREVSGPAQGPIAHQVDLSLLSDEELEILERIRSKLDSE
jgi:DNA-binding CsgD family transcriptional regulator